MSSEIKIRKYHPDDYSQVVKVYQDGIREVNHRAHQSLYNGRFPQLIICELVAFIGGFAFGFQCLDIGYTGSFICGTIFLAIFCCFSLWIRRMWTRNYLR